MAPILCRHLESSKHQCEAAFQKCAEPWMAEQKRHKDVPQGAVFGKQPHTDATTQTQRPDKRKPRRSRVLYNYSSENNQLRSLIITPAATAEPITPATFGPIACISRKFCGLASRPTLLETRAAMGTADTPAEPINGLIGSLVNLFISFAISTPEAVPTPKATIPKPRIPRVWPSRNLSAISLEPTDRPRKMVTMLISAFWAVSLKRSTTPHSRIRLPKQNIPSSGAASG